MSETPDPGCLCAERGECDCLHFHITERCECPFCTDAEAPVTADRLTNAMICQLHPTAYGAVNGTFECTHEEQLDCYHADGTRPCSPEERQAARERLAVTWNSRYAKEIDHG